MAISPYEIENRVLAELLPDERARLDAHLRRIPIPIGTVLYESGVVPSHIYFPTTAIISLHCGPGDTLSAMRERLLAGSSFAQGPARHQTPGSFRTLG